MGRFIPPPPARSARIPPAADAALAAALAIGDRLVARATAHGLTFALDEADTIDLPEPAAARIDRAQLRALASIYLAADLEPAGIVAAAEQLGGLASTGVLKFNLGGAGSLVEKWWRSRRDRMNDVERGAFFARLFGTSAAGATAETGRNVRFEDRMLELCEALAKLDEQGGGEYGTSMAQARVRNAARALAQNLGDAGTAMTAFVAGEVIGMLKDAFAILGHPDIRGALHARDIWDVIRAVARLGHTRPVDAQPYIRRGKAGMILLSWLADALEKVLGGGPLVKLGDPVIGAALDWLEATLTLGETLAAQAGGQNPAPPSAPAPDRAASAWSALGS